MKTKILVFLLAVTAACAKRPRQAIESLQKAACNADSKAFMEYIDKNAVIKNLISFYSEGNEFAEVVGVGIAAKMGDKLWDNLIAEVNEGKKSGLCNLTIRQIDENQNHGKFVVQYGNKKKSNWEVHRNESGLQVVSILPYFDYLRYDWGSNRDIVKAKGSQGMSEVNLDSENSGLIELQYKNVQVLSGILCAEAAFIFFDDKLASIMFSCPQKVTTELQANFEKMKAAITAKQGKPAEKKDGVVEWTYIDTELSLIAKDEPKEKLLMFIAKDKSIDIDAELKKRQKK